MAEGNASAPPPNNLAPLGFPCPQFHCTFKGRGKTGGRYFHVAAVSSMEGLLPRAHLFTAEVLEPVALFFRRHFLLRRQGAAPQAQATGLAHTCLAWASGVFLVKKWRRLLAWLPWLSSHQAGPPCGGGGGEVSRGSSPPLEAKAAFQAWNFHPQAPPRKGQPRRRDKGRRTCLAYVLRPSRSAEKVVPTALARILGFRCFCRWHGPASGGKKSA